MTFLRPGRLYERRAVVDADQPITPIYRGANVGKLSGRSVAD